MNMKMETPAATVVTFSAEKKTDDFKQNFWVRIGAFALSVAGGFIFARLLYVGFAVLPTLGDGAQNKVSPVVTILKILRSGFGN
jgi:hypothetical protein